MTEQLDGFLVLLAQLFGWPTLSVCYVTYHKNFRRPALAELPADTRAPRSRPGSRRRSRSTTRRAPAVRRGGRGGRARARAQLGALVKARDDGTCQSAKKAQQRRVGQLPDRVLPHGV